MMYYHIGYSIITGRDMKAENECGRGDFIMKKLVIVFNVHCTNR